jgi:hypothetical protein
MGEWSINVAGAGSINDTAIVVDGAAVSACRWRRMKIKRRTDAFR